MPTYTKSLADSPVTVAAPWRGALWEPAETVDLDFAAAVALPGVLGLSGDLASLPDEAIERGRARRILQAMENHDSRSAAHLSRPPARNRTGGGWAAVQLEHRETDRHLVFAYRLDDGSPTKAFRLRNLDASAIYRAAAQIAAAGPRRNIRRHADGRGAAHRTAAAVPRRGLRGDSPRGHSAPKRRNGTRTLATFWLLLPVIEEIQMGLRLALSIAWIWDFGCDLGR